MTREQQKKFKELDKALPQMLKEKIKKYKFKKKDHIIWYSKNDLFYTVHIRAGVTEDARCVCSAKEMIKPLWLDDLLWDFLKMESNKDEPLSLRAVGAFTVYGAELYKESCEIKDFSVSELESCVDRYLEHFYNSVQSASINDFIDNIEAHPYHSKLRKALTLIHDNKYREALDCLDGKGRGDFTNKDISIFDAIRDFCTEKLSDKE